LGAYQLLDYLAASCGTVGQAVEQLARYSRVVSTVLDLVVADRSGAHVGQRSSLAGTIEVRIQVRDMSGPVLAEFVAALLVTRFRQFGAPDEGLRSVEFTHEGTEELRAIFPCGARFGREKNAIRFSEAVWSESLPRGDAKLLETLERHAKRLVPNDAALPQRARAEIVRHLDSGNTRVETIARRLGVSPRKLQDALQRDGTTFQALLDEERATLAREYLNDPGLSIAEVAYLLGYAEPSAFTRAFKRWTGRSPGALRSR
jgi:AraC-like DNA-binding protein